jgi:hypothetical protein
LCGAFTRSNQAIAGRAGVRQLDPIGRNAGKAHIRRLLAIPAVRTTRPSLVPLHDRKISLVWSKFGNVGRQYVTWTTVHYQEHGIRRIYSPYRYPLVDFAELHETDFINRCRGDGLREKKTAQGCTKILHASRLRVSPLAVMLPGPHLLPAVRSRQPTGMSLFPVADSLHRHALPCTCRQRFASQANATRVPRVLIERQAPWLNSTLRHRSPDPSAWDYH